MADPLFDSQVLESLLNAGLVFFLYAEVHYTFRFFPFSLYKRRHPEVIADVPFRVNPGEPIPVLVLIKDADRYPVTLETVNVRLTCGNEEAAFGYCFYRELNQKWFHRTLRVPRPPRYSGSATVRVNCSYRRKRRRFTFSSDNYRQLSHQPFEVYLSGEALPAKPGWVSGDLHLHTNFTDDQVEFGAPVEATAIAARAAGLEFVAATDHSYDLDDQPDNYLKNDPQLRKWDEFLFQVGRLNEDRSGQFVVVPGEEVSCRNGAGENVHVLVLNQKRFEPGSGDGGERWFRTRSEKTIGEIVSDLEPGAVAVAAHPRHRPTFLERLLVRRGSWSREDLRNDIGLFQILNGDLDSAFRQGLDEWIQVLLEGRRAFVVAGNDAHGNFNRFRQVTVPMLKLVERQRSQILGWARTCVFSGGTTLSVETILEALNLGRAIVTTGPFADIKTPGSAETAIGSRIEPGTASLIVSARSSTEFGRIKKISLFRGIIGQPREELIEHAPEEEAGEIEWAVKINTAEAGYARVMAETDIQDSICLTNPVWFGPSR